MIEIKKLISTKRFYYENNSIVMKEEKYTEPSRSPFQKDYDRVIFSNAFRRLSKKTQVHPLSKNDHVHNRMTHSLETASVGRSLGMKAGEFLLKESQLPYTPYDIANIIQTACLAHDIGNPPFGHAGEEVIKEWFKQCDTKYLDRLSSEEKNDFLSLDGNAQSLRIVSKIEHNIHVGMGLTFTTLATLVKYPWSASSIQNTKEKFSYFQSESKSIEAVFEELGLIQDGNMRRHPFSYLMEMADDICYGLLDIQDAVELHILKLEELESTFVMLCGKSDW
ncbi:MAG: dNTP triphosphohydrolase, partial [Campylobacterales bacterium]|nr:dNTP triphosphohydrolase [Campylobacterales bacterium]